MAARHLIGYGLLLGAGTLILRVTEYHVAISDLPMQVFVSVVAVMFTAIGFWISKPYAEKGRHPQPLPASVDATQRVFDISKREMDVLLLMAQGYSNQEIADKLFVSLNTVKTHAARLYSKLDVRRRTQAVSRAKELDLIPR